MPTKNRNFNIPTVLIDRYEQVRVGLGLGERDKKDVISAAIVALCRLPAHEQGKLVSSIRAALAPEDIERLLTMPAAEPEVDLVVRRGRSAPAAGGQAPTREPSARDKASREPEAPTAGPSARGRR